MRLAGGLATSLFQRRGPSPYILRHGAILASKRDKPLRQQAEGVRSSRLSSSGHGRLGSQQQEPAHSSSPASGSHQQGASNDLVDSLTHAHPETARQLPWETLDVQCTAKQAAALVRKVLRMTLLPMAPTATVQRHVLRLLLLPKSVLGADMAAEAELAVKRTWELIKADELAALYFVYARLAQESSSLSPARWLVRAQPPLSTSTSAACSSGLSHLVHPASALLCAACRSTWASF